LLGEPEAGLLAKPGDPASLAQAILEVLGDADLASRLKQRGVERVQDYYWDELVKDLDQLYCRSVGNQP
jgi:glycosyltransferase involved in cell wall biosynthesis